MRNKIVLLFVLFMCITTCYAQVYVEAVIDSTQILVGNQTTIHVTATVKNGNNVLFKRWKPQEYITPGIEVVEAPKYDTATADDGYTKITQHLLVTAFEDTLYYIPAQRVKVNGHKYTSKPLALKVLTIPVDTLNPNKFYGIADVQDNPYSWDEWEWGLWFSLIAIMLYVVCILIWIRLKSGKPIHLKVRIIKRLPPHQKALKTIDNIKKHVTTVDDKTYYTQLTDTLRKYIEERFGFKAMEMTSAEIISKLTDLGNEEKMQELKGLFETADLVKFAKHKSSMNENDRNLVSAIDFINETKQENAPTEEKVIPKATEQQKQTLRMRLSLKWSIAVIILLLSAAVTYVLWLLYDYRY